MLFKICKCHAWEYHFIRCSNCVHLENQYVSIAIDKILEHLLKTLWSFITFVYGIQTMCSLMQWNLLSLKMKKYRNSNWQGKSDRLGCSYLAPPSLPSYEFNCNCLFAAWFFCSSYVMPTKILNCNRCIDNINLVVLIN